jgi:hypothetical protein
MIFVSIEWSKSFYAGITFSRALFTDQMFAESAYA